MIDVIFAPGENALFTDVNCYCYYNFMVRTNRKHIKYYEHVNISLFHNTLISERVIKLGSLKFCSSST